MNSCTVKASCRPEDFPAVEKQLHQWEEVDSVGSLREKKNNKNDLTTVFITFRDEETAKSGAEKLSTIEGIIRKEKKQGGGEKPKESRRHKKRGKEVTPEFVQAEVTAAKQDNNNTAEAHRGGERRGRGRGHQGNGGRGRGGRQGGRGRGRSQGRGNGQYQRLPPTEVHVAVADNVPFGTTNMHLMDMFAPYGHVLDINRLELMTMVCFDNPESVQQCIHQLNGTKIGDNIITVSSGTVMIPGRVAAQLGL